MQITSNPALFFHLRFGLSMIVTIPNILSPQEVQQAQGLLQNAPWEDGRVRQG